MQPEHPQHPFKLVRRFLRKHPEFKNSSTQQGFANLIDRSESLVRSVEIGRIKMSTKLAQHIENTLGVASTWLASHHYAKDPIISTSGKPLTHEMVLACLERDTERDLQDVERDLKSIGNISGGEPMTFVQRLAANTGKAVEIALETTLDQGDSSLLNQINELLLKYATRQSPRTMESASGD